MSFISHFTPILIAVSLIPTGLIRPVHPEPLKADWCQCVIFVLNLLGINQIPGEYWTAASLAVPDAAGKTWMDYQGYTKRNNDQIPETGDLLVLDGGAEVITVQTWDQTEHLVPVPVDVWAGHIGIVLDAENVEKENAGYIQVNLLSANWGVNSQPLGVVGSCFNADQSTFLLPKAYKKASFFYATEPVKMRERMVNRAKRWSMLGLTANSQASLDGFPITPSGFISHILQPVDKAAITPAITDIQTALVEIQPEAALEGDLILFGENANPGMGVITGLGDVLSGGNNLSFEVIALQPEGRVTSPEIWKFQQKDLDWNVTFPNKPVMKVRFFRYKDMPDRPVLQGKMQISRNEADTDYQVVFRLTNAGIGDVSVSDLELIAVQVLPDGNSPADSQVHLPVLPELTLKPGMVHENSAAIRLPSPGDYYLGVQYRLNDEIIQSMNSEKLTLN